MVDHQRIALIDDRWVEDTYLLRRTLGMPRMVRTEPILHPGQPSVSVLRDRGPRRHVGSLDPESSLDKECAR